MKTPDNNTPSLAREWAKMTLNRGAIQPPIEGCDAAAEIINNLPDEWVDAADLREVVDNIAAATGGFPPEFQGKLRTWHRRLQALLPSPPTMADMTPDDGKVSIRVTDGLGETTGVKFHEDEVEEVLGAIREVVNGR